MHLKSWIFALLVLCLSMLFVVSNVCIRTSSLPVDLHAQVRAGDDDDDDDDIAQGADDDDGARGIAGNQAGVVIDANGVLSLMRSTDRSKTLWRARRQQAVANLNPRVARASKLRKVSLNRLEQAAGLRLADGRPLTDEMQYLAGLTKIQYLFAYPETGDIVIAGPAEGFALDDVGRPRGITTGRVILELQDLVVALRAFGADGRPTKKISVSIDPTKDGLARMQQFLLRVGRNIASPRQTKNIVRGLKKSLGQQIVTFHGISPRTHFAQVLVEADYRMKLIGIGLERPPVKITSYVAKANPATVSRNAMERWYFVPNYESVRTSEDRLAIQLVGEGVKLVGANELVQRDGTRVDANTGNRASKAFTHSFTKMYPQLTRRSAVYAQLRNLIDMSIVAAAIQQNDYYGQTNWEMELFGDEDAFPVEVFDAPKTVATAVNAIWRGRQLMTPVGGGVNIQPLMALSSENIQEDADGITADTRAAISLQELPESVWWWD